MSAPASPTARYAELHCHTNFSFLDGASAADDLVERAVELGLTALAVTDHQGLYGVVRFSTAAREAGIRTRSSGSSSSSSMRSARIRPGSSSRLVDRPGAGAAARRRRPGRRPGGRSPERLPVDGLAGPAAARADAAARSSRRRQGGPARRRRGPARAAPRPARPRPDRLSEPVPARQPGEPGRDEGRAAVQPGAARRAHRGPRGAVGLSRRRDRPAAPGRRSGGGTDRGRGLCPAVRAALGQPAAGRPAGGRSRRGDRGRRRRLRARAPAPPAARRRLAGGRDGPPGRGARAAGRRHERRPLRPARGSRAPGRPHGDPPRPDGRDAGRPPPARRRVVPEVRRRAARAAPGRPRDGGRRSADRAGLGRGDRQRRRAGRRPARSTSGSRPIASRASRCPAARRRSRTSPSCATRAPGGATTR